jgi:hypothetical protein
MTKSEIREINKTLALHAAGLDLDYLARALSALYRAARTTKSQNEIMAVAVVYKVVSRDEFIC